MINALLMILADGARLVKVPVDSLGRKNRGETWATSIGTTIIMAR